MQRYASTILCTVKFCFTDDGKCDAGLIWLLYVSITAGVLAFVISRVKMCIMCILLYYVHGANSLTCVIKICSTKMSHAWLSYFRGIVIIPQHGSRP